ncbi:S10 family peptidase [Sphingobium vermicomposti]|uniref:Carboxypeptidase C (Cathepsin A) n=1 Tax=Sphingobium vermicomposti TaxID=529005 RepID=A0A846M1W2_9SPHN|nr:peptidase S10 [Sphingobium vermicomposti]NIJ15922.1 carboxypeptidase C (cathepsin A) [Sphingobium vermicomposti]
MTLFGTIGAHVWRGAAALLLMIAILAPAHAEGAADKGGVATPYPVVTHHASKFGGRKIFYTATIGEMPLFDDKRQPAGRIVSISYVATNAGRDRPVLFVFNGGPGSSSVWLHMGLVGPRRAAFTNDIQPETAAPFALADNPDSLLDVADVVLFDPPGTGFSRADGAERKRYFSLKGDADLTVAFIQDWLRRNKRWNAPKYLMGESYGSIRAAAVARALAGTEAGRMEAVTLNGVILLGQVLDFMNGGSGDDRAPLTGLSTMAATAAYHKRTTYSVQDAYAAATRFARDDYVQALFEGDRLSPERRRAIATRLSDLTGLGVDFILEHNLRVTPLMFMSELLRGEGKQIGFYDGRYVLPLAANGGDSVSDDPAMAQYVPGYVAALNDYLSSELKAPNTERYIPIDFDINSKWDWGQGSGVGPSGNYADALATAMRRNPALRLFVAAGLYDLATPPGAAEYVLAHSGIPAEATSLHHYESGHMPYMGPSRALIARDLRAFIRASSGTARQP